MQDEINEKVVALSVKGAKLTAETLQKAIKAMLAQAKKQQEKQPHGKQTLKQLAKQNAGLSNIEITEGNIKAFEQTAKKYGIDFALKKDSTETPPRYLVFFKGRDADALTAAFKEFSAKKLTQEQLAEKFQITSRTVSRWETGSNMPDISMLLELADFYEVDIREIIDGERKSEQMNEELKETVIKVTDYAETNNARLLKRVRIIGITGVITILIAMVMDAGGLAVSPFWESVKRDLYAWTLGTLIANILYTTGWLKRISEKKDFRQ